MSCGFVFLCFSRGVVSWCVWCLCVSVMLVCVYVCCMLRAAGCGY